MIKNIKTYILIFLTISLFSCSKDNDEEALFNTDVDTRVNTVLDSYRKALVESEYGWKVDYQPEDNVGKFNLFLKFNENGSVEVVTDSDNGANDLETTFRVGISHFPELVFENYTALHNLFEVQGFRLGAEFEFLFEDVTADKITLKSKTDAGEKSMITLIKATATDKEYIKTLQGLNDRMQDGYLSDLFFRVMESTNALGDQVFLSSFSLDELSRVATITFEEDGNTIVKEHPIVITEGGFDLVTSIVISGKEFKSFSYDEINNYFIATVDDITTIIKPNELPGYVNNDVFGLGNNSGNNTFGYYLAWGNNDLTSPAFDDIITQVNANLAPDGKTFAAFEFYLVPTIPDGYIRLYINTPDTGNVWSGFGFTSEIINKKLVLTYVGAINANGTTHENQLKPLRDFIANIDGLYYEKRGTFSSNDVSYTNLSGTFTSAEDPSIRVYGLWFN